MECPQCHAPSMHEKTDDHFYIEKGLDNVLFTEITHYSCPTERCDNAYFDIPKGEVFGVLIGLLVVLQPHELHRGEINFLMTLIGDKERAIENCMPGENLNGDPVSRLQVDETYDRELRLLFVREKVHKLEKILDLHLIFSLIISTLPLCRRPINCPLEWVEHKFDDSLQSIYSMLTMPNALRWDDVLLLGNSLPGSFEGFRVLLGWQNGQIEQFESDDEIRIQLDNEVRTRYHNVEAVKKWLSSLTDKTQFILDVLRNRDRCWFPLVGCNRPYLSIPVQTLWNSTMHYT